jgi:hypothetical protein
VSRRRARRDDEDGPEQLALPSPSAPKPPSTSKARARRIPEPEQAARAYIARRAKPSVVPGHVKLTFTLDLPREVAERLSAQAIRDGINLEAVVVHLLGKSRPQ